MCSAATATKPHAARAVTRALTGSPAKHKHVLRRATEYPTTHAPFQAHQLHIPPQYQPSTPLTHQSWLQPPSLLPIAAASQLSPARTCQWDYTWPSHARMPTPLQTPQRLPARHPEPPASGTTGPPSRHTPEPPRGRVAARADPFDTTHRVQLAPSSRHAQSNQLCPHFRSGFAAFRREGAHHCLHCWRSALFAVIR